MSQGFTDEGGHWQVGFRASGVGYSTYTVYSSDVTNGPTQVLALWDISSGQSDAVKIAKKTWRGMFWTQMSDTFIRTYQQGVRYIPSPMGAEYITRYANSGAASFIVPAGQNVAIQISAQPRTLNHVLILQRELLEGSGAAPQPDWPLE